MSREQRGAVVSVRITDDEQARLREVAQSRGTTVSELVRTVVVREMSRPTPSPIASSEAPARIDQGIFWQTSSTTAQTSPGTITMRG